jgi:hypothetical protein
MNLQGAAILPMNVVSSLRWHFATLAAQIMHPTRRSGLHHHRPLDADEAVSYIRVVVPRDRPLQLQYLV